MPSVEHVIGQLNVRNEALIPIEKIMMPPLHLKLGIVKIFIKAIVKPTADPFTGIKTARNQAAFTYLQELFPKISLDKIKEGIIKFV